MCSTLLLFLGSCTSTDREVVSPASPVLVTAEQLAANADFAESVKLTHYFGDVIYNSLRDARSEKVRLATSGRINTLLRYSTHKDSLVLGLKLLGFQDLNQFVVNFNRMGTLSANLNRAGLNFQKLPSGVVSGAFTLASEIQNHKYPNIFASPTSNSQNEICVECHYNNCDECGSGLNPDVPEPGDIGGTGAGSTACIQRANNRRQSRIHTQELILYGELAACLATGAGVGGAVCTGTIWFPPLGVAAGAAGLCITAGGCGFFAYALYRSEVNTIEVEYRQDYAACR